MTIMMISWAHVTLGVGAVLASLCVVEISCMPTGLVVSRSQNGAQIMLPEPMLEDDEDDILDREERYAASGWEGWSSESNIPGYTDDEDITETILPTKPEIAKLQVKTTVSSRFASTLVRSKMKNLNRNTAEATFSMKLPKDAFISEFSMIIEGVVYQSEVMPKQQAQRAYNEAKARGQTAGQVKQSSSDTTKFVVSVSVASHSSVIFNLTYQQLLRRKDGYFEHRINIQPGQIVPDLRVDVHISEPQGLKEVNASWDMIDKTVQSKLNAMTVTNTKSSGNTAHVHFWANRNTGTVVEGPILGELIVVYDVRHDVKAGNIQIVNGYFVHYFSPEGLPHTRKNVVFVIDTSGSMSGTKIQQTKEAFSTILDDVRTIDKFNIVPFESDVSVWRDGGLVEATYQNISRAKEFVNNMNAFGGTNLHGGLMKAIDLLERHADEDALPLIIMLTDGEPTSGISDTQEIIRLVTTAIDGRISLFSIAFGTGADYEFLESLSLRNQGLARKVYEDSSAILQMKGFYDELANPLLFNVRMQYSSNLIDNDSITKTNFMAYYEGTEITVAGKLSEDVYCRVWNKPEEGADSSQNQDRAHTAFTDIAVTPAQRPEMLPVVESNQTEDLVLNVVISAKSLDVDIGLNASANIEKETHLNKHTVDDFAQRLWAYLTINELLLERKMTHDSSRMQELSANALELSLKYHFVTPLTSLLVVTPEGNVSESNEEGGEEVISEADSADSTMHAAPIPQSAPVGPAGSRSSAVVPQASHQTGSFAAYMYDYVALASESAHPSSMSESDMPLASVTQIDDAEELASESDMDIPSAIDTAVRSGIGPVDHPTSFADSDPHFLVEIPDSNVTVCFDINGRPGDVFNLLSDPKINLAVSGLVIPAGNSSSLQDGNQITRTYFGKIGVRLGNRYLIVTPDDITVNNEAFKLPWDDEDLSLHMDGWFVLLRNKRHLIVSHGDDVMVLVMRHRVHGDNSQRVNHLGMYIEEGRGFSDEVHGLIGQFQRKEVLVRAPDEGHDLAGDTAKLDIDNRSVTVTRKTRRVPISHAYEKCWHTPNNAEGLIEGAFTDYRLKSLTAYPSKPKF